MCKTHSKLTHIKQQKYFHHLKVRGYNKNSVLSRALEVMNIFLLFICVTLILALHIVIKQQFFTFIAIPIHCVPKKTRDHVFDDKLK